MIMKFKKFLLSVLILSVTAAAINAQVKQADLAAQFRNLPFIMKQITLPKFPDKNYNIKNYGAVGDGLVLNTQAFEKAISECSKNGGGKVIVPAGIWLTGPIYFKSNINLYLEQGAMIQFTTDISQYPIVESNWEGYAQYRCASPIMGKNLKNIAITGSGIIDGAGQVWRPVRKFKLTEPEWKALIKSGGVVDKNGDSWWPSKEALEASALIPAMKGKNETVTKEMAEKYKLFFRPVLLNFVECRNVWLDGVTFQNSPAWNLHPLLCENVIISNVNVRNAWYSQNGDGIDIESCKNTLLYNSKFDVGDDGICIKSGRDEEGRKRGRPTENLIIANCVVYHGHGGVTVGSEMSGGVKNVKVDNCNFIGTDVGLRFKSTRGRGGVVENIWISNIFMKDIPTEALSFNLYYGGLAPAEDKPIEEKMKAQKVFEVNEATPSFRNIYLKNIFCDNAKDAIILQGLPEMPIKGIEIDNVVFNTERGISIYDADGIKITNAKIFSSTPVVKINQAVNVTLENITIKEGVDLFASLQGTRSGKIFFAGKNADTLLKKTKISPEVAAGALKVK
jgi:polygalacturonase